MPDPTASSSPAAASPAAAGAPAAPAVAPAPAAPASPDPRPAAENSASGGAGVSKDIEALFRFDAFTPPETPAAPATETGGAEAQTPAETPPSPAPAPAPAPAPVAADQSIRDELNRVKGELEALRNPAPKPAETPADDGMPAYEYQIPDPLLAGLRSEDPATAKNAVAALATGVSRSVHQTIRNEISRVIPVMMQMQIQQALQQQEVRTQFFSKYPELGREELRPLLRQITQAYVDKHKPQSISPEVLEGIAQAARSLLRLPEAAPAAPAAPAPTRPAPAPVFGGNSRPASGPSGIQQELQEFMQI